MNTTTTSPASSTDHPVVTTTSGDVRGRWRPHPRTGHRDAAFLSIPYAEAPVGDLRFAAPAPRSPWHGVRDAGTFGATAQISTMSAVTTIPEPSVPGDDVLTANVFTPAPGDRQARLPVLVWIHGGGYFAGSPHSSWYDGGTFTRSGVVTVSLGYRLGIEGWLHLDGAPDNRGLLDWIAGLRWVQENIAAFGGDPDQVTVAGQSAGGGAVLTLLATPRARGLFARAVSLSGAIGADESPDFARATAARFTAGTGVPATTAAAGALTRTQTDRIARELTLESGSGELCLVPAVDGVLLPAPVLSALRTGASSDIPLLLGATSHEFVPTVPDLPTDAARAALTALGLDVDLADRAIAEHPQSPGRAVGQAITDVSFRSFALEVARARARREESPTWLYEFAWPSTAPSTSGLAFHCLDLPFWWDRLDGERVVDAAGPTPPQELADAMHGAFLDLVHGKPLPWAPFRSGTVPAMTWDLPASAHGDPYSRMTASTAPGVHVTDA